jgi:predicted porin
MVMNAVRKSLVALAVLAAFSGVVTAQSSVNVYGVVDVAIRYDNPKLAGADSTLGIASGHQSGSRFGFRGSESLGDGLSAIFTLEGGFNTDLGTSAQGGVLFGRQAYAGLRSVQAGTLAAGRVTIFSAGTGDFNMIGDIDPFSVSFGISSIGSTFSSVVMRIDNSVLWQSPNWSGFRGGLGYSTQIAGTETAGSGNNNRMMFSALNYSSGPLFVALTYDVIQPTNAQGNRVGVSGGLGATEDQTHLLIGGTYDFKMAKLHAAYWWENNQFGNTATRIPTAAESPTSRTADATGWMLGVTVPLGSFRVIGDYQSRDGKRAGTFEGDRNVWSIGTTYELSRRTNLYASYGNSSGEKSLATSNTYNTTQTAAGIRHRF